MSDEQTDCEIPNDADDLVVRAKRDRAAFSQLYEKYYAPIAKYCLRRLLVRTIAEDVIADVFLNVATGLPAFPGKKDSDFRCWIFRIATNAINAYLRQTRRREELLSEAVRHQRLQDRSDVTPDDAEDCLIVHRAVMELDERERTIVMLRFFSDCSHDEIAEIVNSTPGAVRTALSRALARLRERFKMSLAAERTERSRSRLEDE